MSSEGQERQAMQYLERGVIFTVGKLAKLLQLAMAHAFEHNTAYRIGRQDLSELLERPFQLEGIHLKEISKELLNEEIDLEKFQDLLEREGIPVAFAWQDDSLYFYTKDRSVMDHHLEKILEKLAKNPEVIRDLKRDKDLNQEIKKAKAEVKKEAKGKVRSKEMVR